MDAMGNVTVFAEVYIYTPLENLTCLNRSELVVSNIFFFSGLQDLKLQVNLRLDFVSFSGGETCLTYLRIPSWPTSHPC